MTTSEITIEVSELATEKLIDALTQQGEQGSYLRMMVMPGAHGGIEYGIGIEKEAREDDLRLDKASLKFVIDPESAAFLDGARLDYVDMPEQSGFVIDNPNIACSHCQGCGEDGCGHDHGCSH